MATPHFTSGHLFATPQPARHRRFTVATIQPTLLKVRLSFGAHVNRTVAILLCVLNVSLVTRAQNATQAPSRAGSGPARATLPPQKPAPDFSKEPFVIESYATSVRFESDGTGAQTLAVRARAQSESGAQQLHQLAFRYASSNQQIDVHYVRAKKADGTVVNGSPDDIKDVPALSEAAFASLKEKRIAVPALAIGDTLEYEISTRILKPFAPGEFWFAHTFVVAAIVRDERLEISIPAGRHVILKSSPAAPFETVTANGRTMYRWKRANLAIPSADADPSASSQTKSKSPDVQLTSFPNWTAVAAWYAQLEKDRSEPTPEIRAKANELTRDKADALTKTQVLYDFVATKIRAVDLRLGEAGWQPHSASDVLANQFGDSADKNILLESLLRAAGVEGADAALLPYSRSLDTSVPSPGQFEHAITALPQAGGTLWMDTTTEVAPFRMLAAPLRGKSALLVGAGAGKIVQTPADPPFASSQSVDIDGSVSDLGKLTATAHYTMRGDTELVLRLAFHRTPEAQWRDLAQTILTLDGIHGEVTAVKPGDPAATHEPFEFQIDFKQPSFLDWSAKRQSGPLPLLAIGLPDPPADATKPIEIGSPLGVDVKLKLELPANFAAQVPVGSSVSRDYAEFKSSYLFADRTITAERQLDFKLHTVAADRADDYRAFSRAVTADQNRDILVMNGATAEPSIPASSTADDLFEAGLAQLNAGKTASAAPLLARAVELDPKLPQGWNDLGLAGLRLGKLDDAAAAFRKQLALNPADEHANEYLGLALDRLGKPDEAIAAYRKQVELTPLDGAAHAALGALLLAQRDFTHAAAELDKAAILTPDNAAIRVSLGRALLNAGDEPRALAAFEKAAALSPTAPVWNDIAFNLADAKVDLDKALHFAESAVHATAESLSDADVQKVTQRQLQQVASLAECWDTLGWVYFQKGDLASAERYIGAAWTLDQNGEIADHLGQIYEKRGDKDRAIKTYALALAAPGAIPDTRARLTLLLGSNSGIDDLVAKSAPDLAAVRSISAGKLIAGDAQADFLIALSPAGKSARAIAVRFVSGREELRGAGEKLKLVDYGEMFPDASPAKLIRRATLTCAAKDAACHLLLIPAGDAKTQ
jgi:tetratricopeptide (TPR) repeat protein